MTPDVIQFLGLQFLDPPPAGRGGQLIQANFMALAARAPKSRDSAILPPTATDDITAGYYPRSMWVIPQDQRVFVCVRNDPNAAVWLELNQGNGDDGGLRAVIDDETPVLGGNLDASSWRIINLASPVNAGDATNKAFVESRVATVQSALTAHAALTNNPHGVTPQQIGAIPIAYRGVASGVAPLDADGKVPIGFLPAQQLVQVYVVSSQPEMLALQATTGSMAIRTDQSKTYVLRGTDSAVLNNWTELPSPTGAVSSYNGRIGAIIPAYGDYTAAQIAWSPPVGMHATSVDEALNELAAGKSSVGHGHAIADISGLQSALNAIAPSNFAAANHTHIISQITGLQAVLDAKAPYTHTHTIGQIDGLQATLDTKAATNATWSISSINGLQAALDAKASTNTTWTIESIIGLQNALDQRSVVGHSHQIIDISGLANALTMKADVGHVHQINDIGGLSNTLGNKSDVGHTHTISSITGLQAALDARVTTADFNTHLNDHNNPHFVTANQIGAVPTVAIGQTVAPLVNGKVPWSFLPDGTNTGGSGSGVTSFNMRTGDVMPGSNDYTADMLLFTSQLGFGTRTIRQAIDDIYDDFHNGTLGISDITGLQAALSNKSDVSHAHSYTQITGLENQLSQKANVGHLHAIADITGLQNALNAKSNVGHTHAISEITGLQSAIDANGNTSAALAAHVAATNPHNTTYSQTGAQQSTVVASNDPSAADDQGGGHAVNRLWRNSTTGAVWIATSVATGAAVWIKVTMDNKPDSFVMPVRISHFDTSASTLTWHLQAQLTNLSDTQFLAVLVSKATNTSQTGWTFRRDGYATDGSLNTYPSGGLTTYATDAYGEFARAASAFCTLQTADLTNLKRGTTYWLRSRQSSDGGSTWGGWTVEPVTIP